MITITYHKNLPADEEKRPGLGVVKAHWLVSNTENPGLSKEFYLTPGVKGARAITKAEAMGFVQRVWGLEVLIETAVRTYKRCGSKCMNAVCEECKCGCDGKNHGQGRL